MCMTYVQKRYLLHIKRWILYLVDFLYRQLHMEVTCVLLSIYTFILHLYMIFMPFHSNDSTA